MRNRDELIAAVFATACFDDDGAERLARRVVRLPRRDCEPTSRTSMLAKGNFEMQTVVDQAPEKERPEVQA